MSCHSFAYYAVSNFHFSFTSTTFNVGGGNLLARHRRLLATDSEICATALTTGQPATFNDGVLTLDLNSGGLYTWCQVSLHLPAAFTSHWIVRSSIPSPMHPRVASPGGGGFLML